MSANPQPRPFVTGDLDLLISRSLDGDLPGEEERELKNLLAADPVARARYDAMARLVGRLEELPDPETPFALSTRVRTQVEDDTRGLAATLHRFGFYFRPATVGVFIFGIVAVVLTSTIMVPPKPVATVAEATDPSKVQPAPAPEDDGRVNVFFAESPKKDDASPATAAPARIAAAPDQGRANEAKGTLRQEPVLVASAETRREKEETAAFAPERAAPALAAAAPAPPSAAALGAAADESVAEGASLQKAAGSDEKRLRASAPQAAGASRVAGSAQVVGEAAGVLSFSNPARTRRPRGTVRGLLSPRPGRLGTSHRRRPPRRRLRVGAFRPRREAEGPLLYPRRGRRGGGLGGRDRPPSVGFQPRPAGDSDELTCCMQASCMDSRIESPRSLPSGRMGLQRGTIVKRTQTARVRKALDYVKRRLKLDLEFVVQPGEVHDQFGLLDIERSDRGTEDRKVWIVSYDPELVSQEVARRAPASRLSRSPSRAHLAALRRSRGRHPPSARLHAPQGADGPLHRRARERRLRARAEDRPALLPLAPLGRSLIA